jgi:class 3 adenylate cyclase
MVGQDATAAQIMGMMPAGAAAAEQSFRNSLSFDALGYRFLRSEVETDYQQWRSKAVLPAMRLGMIFAALSQIAAIPFAYLASPEKFYSIVALIFLTILPLTLLAMIATFVESLQHWSKYLTPVANTASGLAAVWLVRSSLGTAGISTAVTIMAVFYACTIFRSPPVIAVIAAIPCIVFDLWLLRQDYRAGSLSQADCWTYAFLPLVTLVSGLVICLVFERFTRIVYRNQRVIGHQKQALLEERAQVSRFLAPEVTEMIRQQGLDAALNLQTLSITAVCCDLRGFTAFTQQHSALCMGAVLREYYGLIIDVAGRYGGTVKDFAGDGGLILVGAPLPRPDHADIGIRLARDLAHAVGIVTERLREQGTPLGFGIGAASGPCAVGAIGSKHRLEYTAIGPAVNLASRLCALAEDGEILMCHKTAEGVSDPAAWHRATMKLKGFPEPVSVAIECAGAAAGSHLQTVPIPA